MAGVRVRDNQEMFGPSRGIPDDASDTTRLLYEVDANAHTPSWLSSQEIEKLAERLASMKTSFVPTTRYHRANNTFELSDLDQWLGAYLFGNGWDRSSLKDYDDVEDFRWIFWFDS